MIDYSKFRMSLKRLEARREGSKQSSLSYIAEAVRLDEANLVALGSGGTHPQQPTGRTMPLDLASLRKSFKVLSDLLTASEDDERAGQLNEVERIGVRTGVIQHFEVAYKLS